MTTQIVKTHTSLKLQVNLVLSFAEKLKNTMLVMLPRKISRRNKCQCQSCKYGSPLICCPKRGERLSHSPAFLHFSDSFLMGEEIGHGSFSTVLMVENKDTNIKYAMKVIDLQQISSKGKALVKNEASILQSLNHPYILNFYDFFQDRKKIYFVSDYLTGGTLHDRIIEKTRYEEPEARTVCKNLIDAMRYCHERNIAHRDLKPENILLHSKDSDVLIKIADFGFAKFVPDSGLKTICGSLPYMSPEILSSKPYGKRSDMWSIGVIIYVLLSGAYPFSQKDENEMRQQICTASFDFLDDSWELVQECAKDLIAKLLKTNPLNRLSSKLATEHKWLNDNSMNKILLKDISLSTESSSFISEITYRSSNVSDRL